MRSTRFYSLLLLAIFGSANSLFAQSTAFTYQGRLDLNGIPANGTYDLTFTLFNTNSTGVATAGPITNSLTTVTGGLFTTSIDFGPAAFPGPNSWLEIAVRTNG